MCRFFKNNGVICQTVDVTYLFDLGLQDVVMSSLVHASSVVFQMLQYAKVQKNQCVFHTMPSTIIGTPFLHRVRKK